MTELFSILGQIIKLGGSPAALRGRLSYALARVKDLKHLLKTEPKKRKRGRTRRLNYWEGRVTVLLSRLPEETDAQATPPA